MDLKALENKVLYYIYNQNIGSSSPVVSPSCHVKKKVETFVLDLCPLYFRSGH